MNREEHLIRLETEPATGNQVAAILGEFHRLGLAGRRDRLERLAVSAAVVGLDELASTKDLTEGQAGKLLRILQGIASREDLGAELPASATAQGRWWAARVAQVPDMADRGITRHVSRDGWPESYFTDVVRWLAETLAIRALHFPDSKRATIPGWPDLVLLSTEGLLYRELKAHSDLSADQRATLALLKANRADAGVWDLDDLLSGRIGRELWQIRGDAWR